MQHKNLIVDPGLLLVLVVEIHQQEQELGHAHLEILAQQPILKVVGIVHKA